MKKHLVLAVSLLLLATSPALAGHGLSLDGKLKYGPEFKGFDYTSPAAKVGGTLTLHGLGSYDKMNPFTLKGSAPDMLGSLVFETLAVHSLDEPFSQYGLIAGDITVADDRLSVTYTLRPEARFSDGSPVTAEDVAFSFEMLKSEKASPFYKIFWRDVARAEVLDPRKVRFHFAQKNRELAMITGELPILQKKFFLKHPFGEDDLTIPVGSGPYVVESFDAGKTITFKRNPDYWGWKLPVRRGLYNFERMVVKFFRDPTVALEAFKAGEFDFVHVYNSKEWARDYIGEKFDRGQIVKETLAHKNSAGMQGFVFNLRRNLFQDIRVREALALAFDFEWSNQNLFYGQYTRSPSYFSNSDLAASGAPDAAELVLLEPLRAKLPPAVFQSVQPPPSTTPPASLRDNLIKAKELLTRAGWTLGPDKVLVDGKGNRFQFETLLVNPAFERIMAPFAANLKKLGIVINYRSVDPSLYQQRVDAFDYDMIVHVFGQSPSPGNEQRDFWHSSAADVKGSHNLIGIKDPAVDALVEKLIYAETREALVTACRALDRVLLAGHYVVPHYHIPYHRLAWWNRFARPETVPLYYQPGDWLLAWWSREGK